MSRRGRSALQSGPSCFLPQRSASPSSPTVCHDVRGRELAHLVVFSHVHGVPDRVSIRLLNFTHWRFYSPRPFPCAFTPPRPSAEHTHALTIDCAFLNSPIHESLSPLPRSSRQNLSSRNR
jgi:hypothetical protein